METDDHTQTETEIETEAHERERFLEESEILDTGHDVQSLEESEIEEDLQNTEYELGTVSEYEHKLLEEVLTDCPENDIDESI